MYLGSSAHDAGARRWGCPLVSMAEGLSFLKAIVMLQGGLGAPMALPISHFLDHKSAPCTHFSCLVSPVHPSEMWLVTPGLIVG